MLFELFLFSVAYLVFLLLIGPILRRSRNLIITLKVILPALLLSISLFVTHYYNILTYPPELDASLAIRSYWIGLIILAVYSLNQFGILLMTQLIIRPGHLKIPKFVLNLVGGLAIAVAVLLALRFLFGVDLSGLLLTSTVASAIIGFSLQDTLGNLFAGIALQVEPPFSIDDWVEIDGHEGQVLGQNWRTLMLLTRENHRVSLTNRDVASGKIINYSRPTRRQIQVIYIQLDYSHPPHRVKQLLVDLLNSLDDCEYDANQPPFIVSFDEYAIKYGLRFWVKNYGDILEIRDLVYTRLWYVLKRENIVVPYPITLQYEQTLPPNMPKEVIYSPADIQRLLHSFELLNKLEAAQIEQLANFSNIQLFGTGEYLVHEGDPGDSMFMIASGTIDIIIQGDRSQGVLVQRKISGEFFGEMSLLTGQPRSASAMASMDVEVIIINKDAFSSVLMTDPSILNVLVDGLEAQKVNLEVQRHDPPDQINPEQKSSKEMLVQKIWAYLGLG
ncbi:MAG: small-conductance mechanosensitive channel [Cellvibrionaceae bacterium]|jgi:small-conductance mechanosensitive channel